MPIHTVEPRRLYRQIADQLRLLIERGEYEVGARLPAERDLALQLGVSRPSVREALIALEVEGLIEVRMGSGVYVVATSAVWPQDHEAEGPLEILRARQLIEAELAALAARHITKPRIAALRNALALMRQDIEAGQVPSRGDRLFHVRIAEACDNSVLLRIVCELYDERHKPLSEQLVNHFETAESWRLAMLEHEAVLEAIARHDAEGARQAMSSHLAQSHDRFTASISHPPARASERRKPTARRAA